jgi:hypothetical protein
LSILAKEEIAIYWMAIGAFFLVVDGQRRLRSALFIMVNALWLYLAVTVLIPIFQSEEEGDFFFFERYAYWGRSFGEVFGTITSKPVESLQVLLLPNRVGGLGMMVLPVLLFLLRSHWSVLLLLIPLGINSFSDLVGQHNYRFHYSLLPIVIIVYACIWAIVFIQRKGITASTPILKRATLFMIVASLMLFAGVSQMGLRLPGVLQNYLQSDHDRLGLRIMALIPAQATVMAQNKLVAHLSQRRRITVLSRALAEQAEYYLFDLQSPTPPQSNAEYVAEITALLANSEYGVLHLEDGYILLAKGASHNETDVEAAKKMVEQFFPTTISQ